MYLYSDDTSIAYCFDGNVLFLIPLLTMKDNLFSGENIGPMELIMGLNNLCGNM